MSPQNLKSLRLSDKDLDFLVETVSPEITDKLRLKRIIREDEDFRSTFISDEKIFNRVMDDEEILLKISPTLLFEIFLRKAVDDLKKSSYTLEKTRTMRIPVFNTKDVVELLTQESLLVYLADMLSSFTKEPVRQPLLQDEGLRGWNRSKKVIKNTNNILIKQ